MAKKETLRQRLEREVKPISKEKRKEVVKRGIEAASPAAITKGVVAAKALRATKGVKRAKRISDVVKSKAKAATRGERKIRTDNLKRVSKAKALDKTVKANAEKAKAKVGTQTGMRASRTPDKISGSGMKAENRTLSRAAERGKKIKEGAEKASRRGKRIIGGAIIGGGAGSVYVANKSDNTRGKKEEAARQRVMSEAKAKNTGQSKPAAPAAPAASSGKGKKELSGFGKAFAKAYDGGKGRGSVFEYNGKSYQAITKDDLAKSGPGPRKFKGRK